MVTAPIDFYDNEHHMTQAPTRILLIDGNATDAQRVRALLGQAGTNRFVLRHVDRLTTGIDAAREDVFDVVLLDLSLPDSHGFETLNALHQASREIPIVVLTALENEELGLQLIQHGAQDYLVKSQLTASLLQRAVRYAVERARMANELRHQSALLQSVLDGVADGVVMADEAGRFKVWNPAAEKIVGAGPTSLTMEQWPSHYGLFLPDVVTPYPSDQLPLVRAIRGKAVSDVLVVIRRPREPREVWLSVNARPLPNKNGGMGGGVVVFRDITESRRAEEERQKLMRDRLLLLDSTGDGIYGIDLEGRCTFINKAGATMLGYQPHELMGQDMHELIHHSLPDGSRYTRDQCRIHMVFRDGCSRHVDDEVLWRKDGTSFPAGYSSFPVVEHNRLTGAVVTFVDITEHKRLEEERNRRTARLIKQQSALTGLTRSRLFESPELLPTLQHITEVAATTLATERVSIWRYTDDRAAIRCVDLYEVSRSRHTQDLIIPVHGYPAYFDALATSEVIVANDAHTDKRTAEFSAGYLADAGISSMLDVPIFLFGRLEGVLCHEHVGPIRHWTEDEQMFAMALSNLIALAYEERERRLSKEQLQQSQQRLRNLAGRLESVQEEERIRIAREVHDELGQELTGVKLELAFLRDHLAHAGSEILRRVESISRLVDHTMQSVRKIATELRPVVLDQLGLIPAIEWQAREFQARTGIQCTLNIYLRSAALPLDRSTGVFRIFQEILTNVARHAKASRVEITIQEHTGHLLLQVSDNGRGITDEEVSGSKSLGLLGMRERALLLGGETTIGRHAGGGTVVTLRIPLDPTQPE